MQSARSIVGNWQSSGYPWLFMELVAAAWPITPQSWSPGPSERTVRRTLKRADPATWDKIARVRSRGCAHV